MEQPRANRFCEKDTASTSSGRPNESVMDSEPEKQNESRRDDIEITLMKLRRISVSLMRKNERLHYTERKFFRLFKFLECQLVHSSEKVRYLALEVLCFTVPRLKTKTDSLLKPIMPKVIQCLRGNEEKDIKLKAVHVLRGYFRHSKSLTDFVQSLVKMGLNNKDPQIRISCFRGLNIIFDQDIGNDLFSHIVLTLGNQLRGSKPFVIRTAYRALKHIHNTIGDDRFSVLINLSQPKSAQMYRNIYNFEASDSYLTLKEDDCSTLVSAYEAKRRKLNFGKDFGIFDPSLMDKIEKTRNCERAKAIGLLAVALKETLWTDAGLEPHIVDFLKLLISFISSSNRLIQMYGFDMLKEVIKRMGLILSPHIRSIVKILRKTLASANSKIQSKTEKVLHKLMRHIHPMTVVWELLSTRKPSHKEAVLILVQEKITHFPYYELDMIPLCNFLARNLEDKNCNVSKQSRACVRQILWILNDCPIYGSWLEAVKNIQRNYKFSTETLTDIDVYDLKRENYVENFEYLSDDNTPDLSIEDSFLENSESSATVEVYSPDDPSNCSRYSTVDTFEDESEANSSMKDFANDAPRCSSNSTKNQFSVNPSRKFLYDFNTRRSLSSMSASTLKNCCSKIVGSSIFSSGTTARELRLPPDPNSKNKQRTRFCLTSKSVDVHKLYSPDTKAGGDTEVTLSNNLVNEEKGSTMDDQRAFVTESYEQGGIQVDVLCKDIFNFNIMKIDHKEITDGIEEVDDTSCREYKRYVSKVPLNKKGPNSLKSNNAKTYKIIKDCQGSAIPTDIALDNAISRSTSFASHNNLTTMDKFTDIIPCAPTVNDDSPTSVFDADPAVCIPLTNSVPHTPAYDTDRSTPIDDMCFYTPNSDTLPSTAVANTVSSTSIANKIIETPVKYETSLNEGNHSISDLSTPKKVYTKLHKLQSAQPKMSTPIFGAQRVVYTPFKNSIPTTLVCDTDPSTSIDDMHFHTPIAGTVLSTAVANTVTSPSIASAVIETPVKYGTLLNEGSHSIMNSTSKRVCAKLHKPQNAHSKKHLENNFCNQKNIDSKKLENNRDTFKAPRAVRSNVDINDGNPGTALSSGYISRENVIDLEVREHQKATNYTKKKSVRKLHDKDSASYCNEIFETETPFVPKSRQLPRTPVVKQNRSSEVQPKVEKNRKSRTGPNKRNKARQKICERTDGEMENVSGGSEKDLGKRQDTNKSLKPDERECTMRESIISSKYNSPSNWGGCQWRRDLDYASKAAACAWADQFEEIIESIEPYPSSDAAEGEMKKAIEDLFQGSWTAKEEAMLKVIRLANHHPELLYDKASKIAVALSNEIKNFRQSVAGKAILTVGHLYEIMGKHFESKLRLVIGALLGKSGTRTLAAYYRLVIKSLVKITNATSPQRAITAFIQEGSRQANKAARETAAQFICILTESLGHENCLVPTLSSNILKCAGMFVFDGSALTRYCGKRIFDILRKHPDFEKLKDHHLDVTTAQNLNKLLDQMKTKGVSNEILPINLID